jgi:hypothetical protein
MYIWEIEIKTKLESVFKERYLKYLSGLDLPEDIFKAAQSYLQNNQFKVFLSFPLQNFNSPEFLPLIAIYPSQDNIMEYPLGMGYETESLELSESSITSQATQDTNIITISSQNIYNISSVYVNNAPVKFIWDVSGDIYIITLPTVMLHSGDTYTVNFVLYSPQYPESYFQALVRKQFQIYICSDNELITTIAYYIVKTVLWELIYLWQKEGSISDFQIAEVGVMGENQLIPVNVFTRIISIGFNVFESVLESAKSPIIKAEFELNKNLNV